MTPAVAVGLVLLAIVALLTWWQRRQVRDLRTPTTARPPASSSRTRPAGTTTPSSEVVGHPHLGSISDDGNGEWSTDGSISLGDWHLAVKFLAGPEGPTPRHFAWVQAAIDDWARLERESVALLVDVLTPLEVVREDLEPAAIVVGPVHGVFEGRLEFDSLHDTVVVAYVRSTAMWQALEPHFEVDRDDPSDAPTIRQAHPLIGTIEYDNDGMWSTPVRIDVAGRPLHVVLLAERQGPGDEHIRWLRAFLDRAAVVLADADALALTTAPADMQPAGLGDAIVVIGPDEHGRFIGGITYDGVSSRDEDRRHVWSRDRWTTLSLERH